jgi:hypothetical protein
MLFHWEIQTLIAYEINYNTDTAKSASYLNLRLEIDGENRLRTQLYNKRWLQFSHSEHPISMKRTLVNWYNLCSIQIMFNLWNKIPVPFVHISLMKRYGKVEFITSKDSWSPSWFDLWLQNVCDTVDHEYVTFDVVKSSPFNVHDLLRIFYTSNTTVATSRAVTIYPSGASRFDYGFSSRLCIAQSIVFCVALCRPLVVISSFLPLYCLSFDLRLLINHEDATYHNCYQKLFRYITQLSIYNYIINDILCCNTITTAFKMLIEDIWHWHFDSYEKLRIPKEMFLSVLLGQFYSWNMIWGMT